MSKQRQWELFPQDESLEVGRKDFAKMYIKTIGNRRIGAMALLDSGADLSLMTLQYLKTLCSDDEVREMLSKGESDIKPMTSYSNNQLNVVGRICVKGRFTEQETVGWADLYIQIIDSDDVFYPSWWGTILLGAYYCKSVTREIRIMCYGPQSWPVTLLNMNFLFTLRQLKD